MNAKFVRRFAFCILPPVPVSLIETLVLVYSLQNPFQEDYHKFPVIPGSFVRALSYVRRILSITFPG